MDKTLLYNYKGKQYRVDITYKKIKNIIYRFRNGVVLVSAPKRISDKQIIAGLDKHCTKIFAKSNNKTTLEEDGFYLLGVYIRYNDEKIINFNDGTFIKYKDKDDLNKKLKTFFLKFITPRVRYYEYAMNIKKPYNVKVKNMVSRYGSNSSRTRSLNFSLTISKYSYEIIDAIIVHELAHEFQRNHSKKFYDIVLKYYPNYYEMHKKLRNGVYK